MNFRKADRLHSSSPLPAVRVKDRWPPKDRFGRGFSSVYHMRTARKLCFTHATPCLPSSTTSSCSRAAAGPVFVFGAVMATGHGTRFTIPQQEARVFLAGERELSIEYTSFNAGHEPKKKGRASKRQPSSRSSRAENRTSPSHISPKIYHMVLRIKYAHSANLATVKHPNNTTRKTTCLVSSRLDTRHFA